MVSEKKENKNSSRNEQIRREYEKGQQTDVDFHDKTIFEFNPLFLFAKMSNQPITASLQPQSLV